MKREEGDRCGTIVGVDLYGGKALNDGKRNITDSDAECCALCNKKTGMQQTLNSW